MSSVRRLKERGGGGGKIAAAPAGKISPVLGKENIRSRSTSRLRETTQKPNLRPIPRLDKSAAAAAPEEPPSRRSTSSVPRGRSSSPSEFTRIFSDLRKNSTKISLAPPHRKVSSVARKVPNEKFIEKSDNPKKLAKDFVRNGPILGEFREKSIFRVLNSISSEKASSEFDSVESKVKSVRQRLNSRETRPINRGSSVLEGSKMDNKNPSKLHEKLAFLEGKVKRIASDIKRTKEMLDMNNSDTSKMILSDIQEKISGIEKAMGNVSIQDSKGIEASNVRSSVKGLNVDELEARLFPHHKLIRDRTLSKAQNVGTSEAVDDGNAIASEFLASLNRGEESSIQEMSLNVSIDKNEKFDELCEEQDVPGMMFEDGVEDCRKNKLTSIGCKLSTGGWFVFEGESVILAHDDGSCSFYDIANCEVKAEYKPLISQSNVSNDCWIIRAPSADGCSSRYVVAASAGDSFGSGFCSWDFYSKEVRAFHFENEAVRENRQMWFTPCGHLITSAACGQRTVQLYDIRDGENVMKWELQKPVRAMDYATPLHWRNRGKVVVAESDGVSLWDVSSLSSEALLSVPSVGRKISAISVNNTDAEIGGGVRQRVSSQDAEGNDGVFCTEDSINVLDFRHPSGIGLKIPKVGFFAHSAYSHGDSIYVGCSNLISAGKKHYSVEIQHFSLRKPGPFATYILQEESNDARRAELSLAQVWGNSSLVMGVCARGLFVFDAVNGNRLSPSFDQSSIVKEVIGGDDNGELRRSPAFDYSGSRILLVSKDWTAQWRYLL
ncbi:KIN14B-interacting protein At4g14310 [Andrographis paniculata]|uniref:KIN14B-interacting protein At4g14310 n=1 Tax=Andrographis paniculata TaxID=175694 RepID=UPI0021E9AD1F|nr:KIN14B-interacting protein At4g14310 [Andrographis paniculata]